MVTDIKLAHLETKSNVQEYETQITYNLSQIFRVIEINNSVKGPKSFGLNLELTTKDYNERQTFYKSILV